ncbi:MAG: hypothetical protein QM775_09050 [Pirellulales bacterium]
MSLSSRRIPLRVWSLPKFTPRRFADSGRLTHPDDCRVRDALAAEFASMTTDGLSASWAMLALMRSLAALGHDPVAPYCERLLASALSSTHAYALSALGLLGGSRATEIAFEHARTCVSDKCRVSAAEAAASLGRLSAEEQVEMVSVLSSDAADASPARRIGRQFALAELGRKAAFAQLRAIPQSTPPESQDRQILGSLVSQKFFGKLLDHRWSAKFEHWAKERAAD